MHYLQDRNDKTEKLYRKYIVNCPKIKNINFKIFLENIFFLVFFLGLENLLFKQINIFIKRLRKNFDFMSFIISSSEVQEMRYVCVFFIYKIFNVKHIRLCFVCWVQVA